MGLFDKKYCDICGNKIGLFGNRKLEDGNLCGDCAKKLSPWFSDRRSSTVDEIRGQLEYREMNKEYVAQFNTTASYGRGKKLLLDEDKQLFMVASTRNLAEENPDVLSFSQVTGCELDVQEDKDELKTRDAQGNSVSYNPPRYKYSYDFYIVIHVNHPYFDEIKFQLNDTSVSVETPETGMGYGYNQNRTMGMQQRPVGTTGVRPGGVNTTAAKANVVRPAAPAGARPGVAPNTGVQRQIPNRPANSPLNNPSMRTQVGGIQQRPVSNVQRPAGYGGGVFNQTGFGQRGYTDADMRQMAQTDSQYQSYQMMGEEIKATLLNIRQTLRDEIAEANVPKAKVNCPYCGATTIPDENGACEYCGGSLVGLF